MKILVVDDEPLIRLTVRAVFEDCGAHVVEAGSAAAALTILRENSAIDFLFTDIRMPGMSGIELATAARALRPDLTIALTSGNSDEDVGPYPLLSKPWRSDDLVRLLHRMQADRAGRRERLEGCA